MSHKPTSPITINTDVDSRRIKARMAHARARRMRSAEADVDAEDFDADADDLDDDLDGDDQDHDDFGDDVAGDWVISPSARLVRVENADPIAPLHTYAEYKTSVRAALDAFFAAGGRQADTESVASPGGSAARSPLNVFLDAVRPPASSGSGSAVGTPGAGSLAVAAASDSPAGDGSGAGSASAGDGNVAPGGSPLAGGAMVASTSGASGATSLDDAIADADKQFLQQRNARFVGELPFLILQRALLAQDAEAARCPALVQARDLLSALLDCAFVTRAQVLRGLARVQDSFDDLLLDVPRAPALLEPVIAFLQSEGIASDKDARFLRLRAVLAADPRSQCAGFDPAAAKQALSLAVTDALRASTVAISAAILADAAAAIEVAVAQSKGDTSAGCSDAATAAADSEARSAVARDWLGCEIAKQLIRKRVEATAPQHQHFARRVLAAVGGGSAEITAPPTVHASSAAAVQSGAAAAAAESHLTRLPAHGTILISTVQAERAFALLLRRCDDLVLDIPRAEPALALALACAVKDETVSQGFLATLALAPEEAAGRVVESARRHVLAHGGASVVDDE